MHSKITRLNKYIFLIVLWDDGVVTRFKRVQMVNSAEKKRNRGSCIHSASSIMLDKVKVTDRGHSVGFESFRCPAVFAVVTARCSSHVVLVKKNGGSDGELKWTENS